jgi:dTDP-4-amino-4,6-dideoxygalactose transaminase
VFVDIYESWCINPDLIEAAITEKTKAIIPVHFGGRIADMDKIMDIAKKHNLIVIEDACHAWGAKWKDIGAGVIGHAGVLSFQNNKIMTAGDGGAIVTNDHELATKLQSLTHSGRLPHKSQLEYYYHGTNARITEMQAALLSAQLKRMPQHHARRIQTGNRLTEALGAIEGIQIQPVDDRQTERSWHIFCMTIDPDKFGCSRDRAVEAITAEGLPIGPGYPLPLHKQPVYLEQGGYENTTCPYAESLCDRIGMWFSHTYLLGSDDDIQDIIDIFQKVKSHAPDLT